MKNEIYEKLCFIYSKYAPRRKPKEDSQLCDLWPINDPPDVLAETLQLEDIEKAFDMNIDEEDAVEMFDMNLREVSEFLEKLLNQ